jgi:diaminohydroxyphosphoribosylaminopyrimidine deaminase/5-amino-6-(5-phosphoribosylamino)uracil reductase
VLARCQFGFIAGNCNTIVEIFERARARRALLERSAPLTAADHAWHIVLAAAAEADCVSDAERRATYAAAETGELRRVDDDSLEAVLHWQPHQGWSLLLPESDPRHTLIELYLPICSATQLHPIAVGHLGQSLDGFIATHAGESQYVTGEENIRHLHRLRALCDAVVVGAGTVAADDPQLTTRHVSGPSPVRVVLDPSRRLADHYRVFNDAAANTLYVCGKSMFREGDTHVGQAAVVAVDDEGDRLDVTAVLKVLRARGCHRIFVEGGGVTVSMFLEANALDRLQITIAPLLIGEGRPAIRLAPRLALSDCHRPRYRVYRMGADVLFDCDLRSDAGERDSQDAAAPITRVI